MKNKFTIIAAFCVALGCSGLRLNAQMSGVYTINQTIAASSTNFVSFTALAAALNTSVVTGPVTVNVVTGTGPYTEQMSFNPISGSSLTNTITINGNNNTLTFAGVVAAPHTLMLGGADFMYFNNLNVIGTGATYALVCHLWNQSDGNHFDNCTFTAPTNGTGTSMIPFSLSGSQTSGTSSGNSGSNNILTGCTMNSGYYNTVLYGNSVSPFNTGNAVINCNLRDYYIYGSYNAYCQGSVIRGNTMERPNRTTVSTGYGVYITSGSLNLLIEGNHIQKLFGAVPTSGSSGYGIYFATAATLGNENVARNNVVSDMVCNGQIMGIYINGYNYNTVYHNTISLDDLNSTYTGSTYGIYCGASAGVTIKNNLVSIRRGGTGTKYGLYYYSASGITSNFNMVYVNTLSGVGYVGYYNSGFTTMAAWKTANGWDQSSASIDPLFTNPALLNYMPAEPSINNMGQPLGVLTDVTGLARNLAAPDVGAYEFFNTQCTGTPNSNTVTAPTNIICPVALTSLGIASTYTVNGLNYQWGYSTVSPLGPFTAIPGATLASYITPTLATSTWYTFSVSCANGGSTITATTGQVQISTTIINTVPYFEGFEGILNNNDLPNCSWLVNNANAQTRTTSNTNNQIPNTGNKFASVYGYNLTNTSYYWTNGIQLKAGVTYSASMFYTTEYYGYTNFTEVSINLGTSQSSVGLTNIAIQTNPISPVYKQLSNTFTVAASGIYYVAIKVSSTAGSFAYYLSWDDLSITVPCNLNPMSLSLTGTTASTLCAGLPVNLTASGANTYTWSTGANTATISDVPSANTTYIATGTSTLTGCVASISKNIVIKPSPQVSIFVFNPNVCAGSSINLNAVGALTYTWSSGNFGSAVTTIPGASTTYTVLGSNSFGCIGAATQLINVNQLPPVAATNVPPTSCPGDNIVFTGSGATTYTWVSNTTYAQGSQVTITSPNVSTIYTVTGTDANGCSKSVSVIQQVVICTGINAQSGSIKGLNVYPNPNNGAFTVELFNGLNKTMEVSDLTGRIILSQNTMDDKINLSISNLANGIYYLKLKSNNAVDVLKIIKQ